MREIAPGVIAYGNPGGPPVYTRILTSAFWDRFTSAEMLDYDVAMQHDPAASLAVKRVSARLRIFRREASDAGSLRLGSNKVESFVNGLESQGILSAGRAAAILSAPITQDEAG